MPTAPVQGTLQAVGDTITSLLGNVGVGNPADVAAILSLTGGFTNAQVAIEAIPLGQPMTQNVGGAATPTSPGEWVDVATINLGTGAVYQSPIGPLTSNGAPGSGFAFSCGVGIYQALRLRLVNTSGGAIVGGIATVPFPVSAGLTQQITGAVSVSGTVGANNQGNLLPPILPYNPNSGATGAAAVTTGVPADSVDGMQVYDPRERIRFDRIEEWLKRIQLTILLCFKNPEMSNVETLAAANTDMTSGEDPMDVPQGDGDWQQVDVG